MGCDPEWGSARHRFCAARRKADLEEVCHSHSHLAIAVGQVTRAGLTSSFVPLMAKLRGSLGLRQRTCPRHLNAPPLWFPEPRQVALYAE
jgi:hypothetical protein